MDDVLAEKAGGRPLSASGYAVVLMMCWIGRPCQMVAIRPQSYSDLGQCEQAADQTLRHWQKASPLGAELTTTCRTTNELCNLFAMRENPLLWHIGVDPNDRFSPAAVANRLMRALHLLCNSPRPGGCGDEKKAHKDSD